MHATDFEGEQFGWAVVRLIEGGWRTPVMLASGLRGHPTGVNEDDCNWICDTNMDDQWQPNGEVKTMLINEGKALAARIGGPGPFYVGLTVFTCGSAEPIRLLPRGAEQGQGGSTPIGGGLMGPVAPAGARAGGLLGVGMPPGAALAPMDLGSPMAVVQQLREMNRQVEGDRRKDKKKKEKEQKKKEKKAKDKKKKKHHKKKKKKSRRSGSSSSRSRTSKISSSRSSRSRSRSSRSGSSSSISFLRWKDRTKKKKVTPQQLNKIETVKSKRKGDLVPFAASHPGALSAFFLAGV